MHNFIVNPLNSDFPFMNFRKLWLGNSYQWRSDGEEYQKKKKRREKMYSEPDLKEEYLRKEKQS